MWCVCVRVWCAWGGGYGFDIAHLLPPFFLSLSFPPSSPHTSNNPPSSLPPLLFLPSFPLSPPSPSSPLSPPSPSLPSVYEAMESYVPQNDDEVGFMTGDKIEVLSKSMDGWWKIRCVVLVSVRGRERWRGRGGGGLRRGNVW